MGSKYAFLCPGCGYANDQCCGGTEYGKIALSTIHCATCAALYDVTTAHFGYTYDQVEPRCPKNKEHEVVLWEHPGPCPKCSTVLTKLGLSCVWD